MAGSLLVAGACAPVSNAAFGAPEAPTNQPKSERVLAFGFEAINERYLTDVVIGNAALEGMRGLANIDPAIAVERAEPRRVALRYGKDQVADYPAPADNDPDGWAALTMAVAHDLANISPRIRDAGDDKVIEAVFDATLAKLDFFSRYAGPAEARDHRSARNGFGGIGVRYDRQADGIALTEVMAHTPAAEANLRVGDHVTGIDGTNIAGLAQEDVSNRLRGPIDSAVALSVRHEGASDAQVVKLHRTLIVPQTVKMTIDNGIATIAISSFNQNTAENLTEAVKKAKETSGFKGVVLDLRGNPGGLLDQGVEVADLFMDHGRIVSTRGRNPASVQVYDAKPGNIGEDVPLVVLVDGKSASAAEIVTAALEDSGRAVVVGTNSYGKGTVQTVIRMPNDGEMTLTWSRFYSPSGYALHGLGVLPTICAAGNHPQTAALLAGVQSEHSSLPATLAAWRASTVDQLDLRKHLRSSCPNGKEPDAHVEAELARDLIENHSLYSHALSLTAAVSTAYSAPAAPATIEH